MAKIRYADDDENMRHFAAGVPAEKHTTTVWMHDSGLVAEHDMACFVCFERPAVLALGSRPVFEPCGVCTRHGWRLARTVPTPWWAFW